ncbi:MAG: hypothetical protein Q7R56_00430 [Nanoarchaeota archaeon]|nr:hypothetical protein [Nanoarchaeota archaeon]
MNTLPIIEKANVYRWLYEHRSSDTTLNSKDKDKIRKHFASKVSQEGSYLGFWGKDGLDYYQVKKAAPNARIKMLDDARGFKNKIQLQETQILIPELTIEKLEKFAKKGKETFEVFWNDLCGPMGEYVEKQCQLIPRILQGKGYFGITVMETRDPYFPKWMTREERRTRTIKVLKDELAQKGVIWTPDYSIHYNSLPMDEHRKTMRTCPMWTIGGGYVKI